LTFAHTEDLLLKKGVLASLGSLLRDADEESSLTSTSTVKTRFEVADGTWIPDKNARKAIDKVNKTKKPCNNAKRAHIVLRKAHQSKRAQQNE